MLKVSRANKALRGLSLALIGGWLALAMLGSQAGAAQAAVRVGDMPVFAQQHYLSCEYAATRAAVARWGVQISEADFINGIGVNENPHIGFRGNIDNGWGGTDDYGIYAEPIARFLATKGLNTKLIWDGVDSIKEELSYGRPVVVWIVGGMGYSNTFEANAAGQNFLLMPYEHAVTVYGYDENGVYVADPGFGTFDYYNWADFRRSWGYLQNMAMSVWPADQGAVKGERPGIAPQFYRYWLRGSGMELIGQPVAAPYESDSKIYQYFERARLEYDNAQPPTQPIQRGLLGRELTDTRFADIAFLPLTETEVNDLKPEDRNRFFKETGYLVSPQFTAFWEARGGLEVFGYPISRVFVENGKQVQYFERARLEVHFVAFDQPVAIRLGLLGSEKLFS